MADFDSAIKILLGAGDIPAGLEGGYVNNPNDPGGPTNFGLSQRYLNGFKNSEFDDNKDGFVSAAEIKDITKRESIHHYKTEWWDKYGYDRIRSDKVAAALFEKAVHFGQQAAVKLIQKACNKIISPKSIYEDGVMGPITVNALNGCDDLRLLGLFRLNAQARYRKLLEINPRLGEFSNNWLRRALK